MSATTTRVFTAAVLAPLVLLAIFKMPSHGFFLLVLLAVEIAAFEFVRISRSWAPHAPLEALLVLIPPMALLLSPGALLPSPTTVPWEYMLVVFLVLSIGVSALVMMGRTPVAQSISAIGVLGFGLSYFSLPVAAISKLQRLDPWVVVLLLAVIWMGDSAAYFVGRSLGRTKLAPVISPNKTWEGAIAGLVAGVGVAAIWSWYRLGAVEGVILGVAAVTSVAGQLGDLVESMLKRGASVKDSGSLLPGHGGMLDRLDALLFAAPVMAVCLWVVGSDIVVP